MTRNFQSRNERPEAPGVRQDCGAFPALAREILMLSRRNERTGQRVSEQWNVTERYCMRSPERLTGRPGTLLCGERVRTPALRADFSSSCLLFLEKSPFRRSKVLPPSPRRRARRTRKTVMASFSRAQLSSNFENSQNACYALSEEISKTFSEAARNQRGNPATKFLQTSEVDCLEWNESLLGRDLSSSGTATRSLNITRTWEQGRFPL